jgi:hypothetical protein
MAYEYVCHERTPRPTIRYFTCSPPNCHEKYWLNMTNGHILSLAERKSPELIKAVTIAQLFALSRSSRMPNSSNVDKWVATPYIRVKWSTGELFSLFFSDTHTELKLGCQPQYIIHKLTWFCPRMCRLEVSQA